MKQNEQYFDQIKTKLINLGYDSTDIDEKVTAIIQYANRNDLNAIKIMESGFDFENLDSTIVGLLNYYREPTSYITKRIKEVPTSKFVRRNIIE
ncbi:hypothetical protein PBI_SCTP2_451 [Salicola phage SCTP-2]|nr:hypothetical protein PBI_SCTP2_451 [Salicola phage SCTP-2]